MRVFALVEVGRRQAIDLYLRREDAHRELEEILGDGPDWTGLLDVVPIELDEREMSAS